MCTIKVHHTILEHVIKASRKFLWHGTDINRKGNCLANWKMVCKPKNAGGLGVLNLKTHNMALLLKHLHKFYNKHDIPWVKLIWNAYYNDGQAPHSKRNYGSFWWMDCLSLNDIYRRLTRVKAYKGDTILLWKDKWQEQNLQDIYPNCIHLIRTI